MNKNKTCFIFIHYICLNLNRYIDMNNEICVLDVETSGISSNDFVLELGIVSLDLNTGEIKPLFDKVFFNPKLTEKHRDAWIFKNSSLTVEEVRNANTIDFYREEINLILNKYSGRVTAWNRDFDKRMMGYEGFDFGKDIPCPMVESTDYFGLTNAWGNPKWPKAQEAWDITFPDNPFTEEHRGLSDAAIEAAIIYELYKKGVYKPF